jgi:hypothetical protein
MVGPSSIFYFIFRKIKPTYCNAWIPKKILILKCSESYEWSYERKHLQWPLRTCNIIQDMTSYLIHTCNIFLQSKMWKKTMPLSWNVRVPEIHCLTKQIQPIHSHKPRYSFDQGWLGKKYGSLIKTSWSLFQQVLIGIRIELCFSDWNSFIMHPLDLHELKETALSPSRWH